MDASVSAPLARGRGAMMATVLSSRNLLTRLDSCDAFVDARNCAVETLGVVLADAKQESVPTGDASRRVGCCACSGGQRSHGTVFLQRWSDEGGGISKLCVPVEGRLGD